MTVTDVNVVKSAIFERPDDANKGTLGSLLCVCGSYGMAGAAVMSAKGALRTPFYYNFAFVFFVMI